MGELSKGGMGGVGADCPHKWTRMPREINRKEDRAELLTMFAEGGLEVRVVREERKPRGLGEALSSEPCYDYYVEFKGQDK